MKIIRNIIVSLSMYSRIPMPVFVWEEDDTKYALGFIGLVGIIIGALEYGIVILERMASVPIFVQTFLWAALPLIVTGGFHIDGFLDVQDAFNSYKPKEEKLKILKDSNVGAFAVISLALYGLLYLSFTYLLLNGGDRKDLAFACTGFVLMRALGGYLALTLKHARAEGMLHEETKGTNKVTKAILLISLVLCAVYMFLLNLFTALAVIIVLAVYILWYKKKCMKEFGGINGDTIGYFITEGELLVMIVTAVFSVVNICI